jgi:hypothetical protein
MAILMSLLGCTPFYELTGDLGRSDSLLQEVCLLYWLEVMSLIKEVPASLIALLAVAQLEWINLSIIFEILQY